jgi:hypothetical protein
LRAQALELVLVAGGHRVAVRGRARQRGGTAAVDDDAAPAGRGGQKPTSSNAVAYRVPKRSPVCAANSVRNRRAYASGSSSVSAPM